MKSLFNKRVAFILPLAALTCLSLINRPTKQIVKEVEPNTFANAECMEANELKEDFSIEKEHIINNAPQSAPTVELDAEIKEFLTNLTDTEEEFDYFANQAIDFDYNYYRYGRTTKDNNFLSEYTKEYNNINGKTVTADMFYIGYEQKLGHPNIGQAILLYQAIKYKLQNPDDYNEINVTSFRLSVIAGFCIVPSSPYYGMMKSMPDTLIDTHGFVRMSYLMVIAAKLGIKVNIIAQQPGYSDYGAEIHPTTYFTSIVNEPCFSKVGLVDKKVGDFLTYRECEWLSYEGKAAADMYHFKTCTVLHYLDKDNIVRNYGVYYSSANIDGVNGRGVAGLIKSQTGIILTNHRYIYLTTRNFVRFSLEYCGYDMASDFRFEYQRIIKRQKQLIKTKGYEYLAEELMIYLGSEQDNVFELVITPLDCAVGTWSMDNPFCKYIEKLQKSRENITLKWNNAKSSMTYEFINTFFKATKVAFKKNRGQLENTQNVLSIKMTGIDPTLFDDLEVGTHLKTKIVNPDAICHEKDAVFCYEENGMRHSVAVLNSLNEHQGAFWYQVNHILTIKENALTGTDLVDTLCALM